MGLIRAPYAPLIPFERPTEDADGNVEWQDLGSFTVVVEFSGPALQLSSGASVAQAGTVYAPRGVDLQTGDRFTWGGEQYLLTSGSDSDLDHPFTGDDFGWVSYTCMGKPARWGNG